MQLGKNQLLLGFTMLSHYNKLVGEGSSLGKKALPLTKLIFN